MGNIENKKRALSEDYINNIIREVQIKEDNMKNPFLENEHILLNECYGTAIRLQNLCLHLYNSSCATVDLSGLLGFSDESHLKKVFDMIKFYAKHGENDPEFMRICRILQKRLILTNKDKSEL